MTPASSSPPETLLAWHPCVGDDGTCLMVIEYRYMLHEETPAGVRVYPGARRWALDSGEPVRVIDRETFEVVATGELLVLRH